MPDIGAIVIAVIETKIASVPVIRIIFTLFMIPPFGIDDTILSNFVKNCQAK